MLSDPLDNTSTTPKDGHSAAILSPIVAFLSTLCSVEIELFSSLAGVHFFLDARER